MSKCDLNLQVFVTSQYLAIAMEYAAGGDMFEHVVRKGGLKESEARWFFQQLLVGVDYVHRMVSASCFRHCSILFQVHQMIQLSTVRHLLVHQFAAAVVKKQNLAR